METNTTFGHIMVDLETFGTDNDSVICSIGAVEFDITTGKTGREFYEKIDIQSALDAGMKVKGSTLIWWLKQSEDARKELYNADTKNIVHVLQMLQEFFNNCGIECQVWGNSNRFDLGILHNAYKSFNTDIPWDFRKERDVRTLVSFRPEVQKNCIFEGTAHNALADCKHQIKYCSQIWNTLNVTYRTITIPVGNRMSKEEQDKIIAESLNKYNYDVRFNDFKLPSKPSNINEARQAIADIFEEYKGELLLDQDWIVKNILLPDNN